MCTVSDLQYNFVSFRQTFFSIFVLCFRVKYYCSQSSTKEQQFILEGNENLFCFISSFDDIISCNYESQ